MIKDGELISVRVVMRVFGIYYEEFYIFDIYNFEIFRFFLGKVVNVLFVRVIGEYFCEKLGDGFVFVFDKGVLERVRVVVEVFGFEYSYFEKCRIFLIEVEMYFVDVDVKGKNVLIVDDIISMGGIMVRVVELLRKFGVKKIYVFVMYGVFVEGVIERVSRVVDEFVVINIILILVLRISIVLELLKFE